MPDINYDPYSQEKQQTIGQMVGEVAKMSLNPTTYLYPYAYWPGTYSKTKGIWTPFETKKAVWQKEFSKIIYKEPFKIRTKSFYGGFEEIASVRTTFKPSRIPGALWRLGPLGKEHRILTEHIQASYAVPATKKQFKTSLKRGLYVYRGAFDPSLAGKEGKYERQFIKKAWTNAQKGIKESTYSFPTMYGTSTEIPIQHGITRKVKYAALTRWGLRASKIGTGVGIALFALDVAGPLAQAGFNALNNLATEYQQRFMPEMGGKLQASYLSYGAATERQRAIQAISKAYINGRSALGQESLYYS
jgi:hypothetical protein